MFTDCMLSIIFFVSISSKSSRLSRYPGTDRELDVTIFAITSLISSVDRYVNFESACHGAGCVYAKLQNYTKIAENKKPSFPSFSKPIGKSYIWRIKEYIQEIQTCRDKSLKQNKEQNEHDNGLRQCAHKHFGERENSELVIEVHFTNYE